MSELWNNLRTFWTKLTPFARAAVLTGALALVFALLVASWWITHTRYQVLFSDLSQRDAAAVVAELKTLKVPYALKDGGTTVLVDEKVVLETRLSLMSSGVPISGGVGFELFDNKDVGMTEYMQKIDYQRALQGELARTILANDQLRSARVHLVIGDNGLFSRNKSQPKAAVSVVLKPGARLAMEQVLGIQRLVAAAVPSLDASSVTITDQRGVALSAEAESDVADAAVSGKLRFKKQADDYLTRKVAELLDRTYGPGQAMVSVDVTLNYDEIRRTEQSITPVGGRGAEVGAVVRRRESLYRQPSAQNGGQAAGQPLAKSNDATLERSSEPNGTLTSTTDVEYELSKTAEQVLSTPGGIRRLSIGVIVPPTLSEDQLDRIRQVVSMAVGFNPSRGDAITVQPLDRLLARPAGASAAEAPAPAADMAAIGGPAARWGFAGYLGVAGVLAALLLTIGASVVWGRRNAGAERQDRLSDRDRHMLLREIKSWIESEQGVAQEAPKP
jgi:flagellar M-ring protein FliF